MRIVNASPRPWLNDNPLLWTCDATWSSNFFTSPDAFFPVSSHFWVVESAKRTHRDWSAKDDRVARCFASSSSESARSYTSWWNGHCIPYFGQWANEQESSSLQDVLLYLLFSNACHFTIIHTWEVRCWTSWLKGLCWPGPNCFLNQTTSVSFREEHCCSHAKSNLVARNWT